MNDKISINVITYNQELYIEECIKSILNQTHKNIEILIADDCSTDNTLKIVKRYQKKHPNIITILPSKKNQGVAKNATKGLVHSTGDFFCSFAGDDVMLPNNLETQHRALITHPAATMSHGNAIWCQDTTDKELKLHHQNQIASNSYEDLLKENFIVGPATLIRKKFLPDSYRTEAASVCDWTLSADVLQYGNAIYIDEPLIKYRRHDKNLSGKYEMHIHAINALNYMKHNIRNHHNIHLGYASQYRSMIKKNLLNYRFLATAKSGILYYFHKFSFFYKDSFLLKKYLLTKNKTAGK